MEAMYQTYKDIVDFRLIYVREVHPVDSPTAFDLKTDEPEIWDHTTHAERCTAAEMLISSKALTMPVLIDDMNDAVSTVYRALPDRVLVIRTDGRFGVVAADGPWGFEPGLAETAQWLKELRENGEEPPLPDDAVPPGEDMTIKTSLAVAAETGD